MRRKSGLVIFAALFIFLALIPFFSTSEGDIIDISGDNIVIEEITNEGDISITPSNNDLASSVTINGLIYNLQATEQGLAYINVDSNGVIIRADYIFPDVDGIQQFGNTVTHVPENSRIYIPNEEEIVLYLPEGSQFLDQPFSVEGPSDYNTIIIGKNTDIGEDIILDWGQLGYLDSDIFVPSQEDASINSVVIRNLDNNGITGVVLDGGQGTGESVSLDFERNSIVFSSNEDGNSEIILNVGNPFIEIDQSDWFSLIGRADSIISIENRDEDGLVPKITSRGDISIQNGDTLIYSQGGSCESWGFRL